MHIYLVPEETRKQLLSMLTGGIVVAGQGDILDGGGAGGDPKSRGGGGM